jgi:hypothetical protein
MASSDYHRKQAEILAGLAVTALDKAKASRLSLLAMEHRAQAGEPSPDEPHLNFGMVPDTADLTGDQFVSLLMLGDAGQNIPAPIIPIDHELRLLDLGYAVSLLGRLRITTPGRQRIDRAHPRTH